MEWFDTNKEQIRERDNLSPEQIQYIQKPSITIFGPLNALVRKQWDFLLVGTGLSIFAELVPFEGGVGSLLTLVWIAIWIWLIFFGIFHGRRLAWNRNEWGHFSELEYSEEKWKPWVIVFLVLGVLLYIIGALYVEFLEGFFSSFTAK